MIKKFVTLFTVLVFLTVGFNVFAAKHHKKHKAVHHPVKATAVHHVKHHKKLHHHAKAKLAHHVKHHKAAHHHHKKVTPPVA